MIQLSISPQSIDLAKQKASQLGVLNNSITGGGGNVAGYLGEIVVANYYQGTLVDGNRDYDLTAKGFTVDVKTKRRNVVPRPEYFATVAALNTTQKCDYYVFVSVLNDFKTAWICGWSEKRVFFQKAAFFKKGDVDPTGNGWTFREDCYNLAISELDQI